MPPCGLRPDHQRGAIRRPPDLAADGAHVSACQRATRQRPVAVDNGNMAIRAQICWTPTAEGGLAGSMPSPCQSLLLRVSESTIDFGVLIVTDSGHALTPGGSENVVFSFWADDAELEMVQPGSRFSPCATRRGLSVPGK